MITLNLEKTTGKQAHRIVTRIVKERSRKLKAPITKTDFCKGARLSRVQLYRYSKGIKPGPVGIHLIAKGLKAWGYEVELIV